MDYEEYIKEHILLFDDNGKLKCRERVDLEYKETFNLGSATKYARTMASFANNIGGYIIFGVKDKPREVVGVNSAFEDFNQEKLTEILNSYFSPEIMWEAGTVDSNYGKVGYIYVAENIEKPVIAIKGDGSISNGDVYYRYKALTEKIKYPEMMRIINEREKRLQDSIIKMIEAIKDGNTPNIGIVNYSKGKISTPYGVDISVDKKLIMKVLKKAKFIKKGSLKEEGEPVLMVTGNIDLAEEIPVPEIEPDLQYPYIQKDIKETLHLTSSQTYALVWYYKLKGNKMYHIEVSTSKNTKAHKFSDYALQFLKKRIEEHSEEIGWLDKIKDKYFQSKRSQGNVK